MTETFDVDEFALKTRQCCGAAKFPRTFLILRRLERPRLLQL